MKTLVSVAVAGALAVASLTAIPAAANAGWHDHGWQHDGWRDHGWRDHGRRDHGWHSGPGAGFAAGTILGLTFGALATGPYYAPPPPPPPPLYPQRVSWAAHVNWCEETYNTYSPETDTWYDYNGTHRCVGP